MSFRKMLKSKGPKIDPCETLLSTFPHSLKELFILHNLKSVSKPYALDFASSSSWFRLSKALDQSIIINIILKREFFLL